MVNNLYIAKFLQSKMFFPSKQFPPLLSLFSLFTKVELSFKYLSLFDCINAQRASPSLVSLPSARFTKYHCFLIQLGHAISSVTERRANMTQEVLKNNSGCDASAHLSP